MLFCCVHFSLIDLRKMLSLTRTSTALNGCCNKVNIVAHQWSTGLKQGQFTLLNKIRNVSSVVPDTRLDDFPVQNEPVYEYKKGSPERIALEEALKRTAAKCEEVPIVIGGKEIRSGKEMYQVMPHNHSHKLAKFYYADSSMIKSAIKAAVETQPKWDKVPFSERLKIWEKAAVLMAGKYRQDLNAATMLGQAKTIVQAEIDSAAELIDFIRYISFSPLSLFCLKKYCILSFIM